MAQSILVARNLVPIACTFKSARLRPLPIELLARINFQNHLPETLATEQFPSKMILVRKTPTAHLIAALIPLFAGTFLPHVSFGASKGTSPKMNQKSETDSKHPIFDSAAIAYIQEQIGGMPSDFVYVHYIQCTDAKISNSGSRSESAVYVAKNLADGNTLNFEHYTQGKLQLKPKSQYVIVSFRESPTALTLVSAAEVDPKKFKPEVVQAEVAKLIAQLSPMRPQFFNEKAVLLEHVRGSAAPAAMKYTLPATIAISAKPPELTTTEVRLTVEVKNNGDQSESVIVFADKNPLYVRLIENEFVKYKPTALVPPAPPPPHRFTIAKGQVLYFTQVIKKSELDFKPSQVSIEWEFLAWKSPRPKGTWSIQLN